MRRGSRIRVPGSWLVAAVLFAAATIGTTAPATMASGSTTTIFVPIVLSSGGAGGSFYTSELILSNRGTTTAAVELRYTSAFGGGDGTCSETLLPGEQRVIPDTIAYLYEHGVALPASGGRGGTLNATFSGLSSADAAAVTVRTTTATAAPLPIGAAGLAYPGVLPSSGTTGEATLFGLRATSQDRSHVAVYNPASEPVTVKVTVHAGNASGASVVKEEAVRLPGFGWQQLSFVFDGTGITDGWVTVVRTEGSGVFGAYGVVNCNGTSDGSFVPATVAGGTGSRITVPVLVETTSGYVSELVLANRSASAVTLTLNYVESLATTPARGTATVALRPREQLILPDALEYLRGKGIPVGAKGAASYAGALRVTVSGAALADVFAGARTASLCPAGGQFGLFTSGVYDGQEASTEALLYGLRADALNRTNVAVVNAGADGSGVVTLELQACDGDGGGAPRGAADEVTLGPGEWKQASAFLNAKGVRNGWVRVRRLSGTAPWIAYGVVNDGGNPGERTGDGAYVPMVEAAAAPPPPPPWVWKVSSLPDTDTSFPVLAWDGTGNPMISFYSTKTAAVMLARWDPVASSWQSTIFDPVFENWHPPDLAVDPADGNPSVAYGADAIKFAHWSGTSWKIETVETVGTFQDEPSLVYGPDGRPAISFRTQLPSVALRFARWNGTSWDVQTVDPDPSVGGPSSLAFDRLGNPAIAYPAAPDVTVKLARWNGSKWDVEAVELGVKGYRCFPSLAFDATGMPALVHGSGVVDGPGIRFVRWDGTKWKGEGVAPNGWRARLAFDPSGVPVVAFKEFSPATAKVARQGTTGEWTTEVVDSLPPGSGGFISLRIDPAGKPSLAYDELKTEGGRGISKLRFARVTGN